jgi:hypothetical protein
VCVLHTASSIPDLHFIVAAFIDPVCLSVSGVLWQEPKVWQEGPGERRTGPVMSAVRIPHENVLKFFS